MTTLSPADVRTVDWIAQRLLHCRSLLFITGAGMSADSGLPTYRGVGGLYNSGETEEGLEIEELLSGDIFRQRPEWTWKYLRQIEQACRGERAVILQIRLRCARKEVQRATEALAVMAQQDPQRLAWRGRRAEPVLAVGSDPTGRQ